VEGIKGSEVKFLEKAHAWIYMDARAGRRLWKDDIMATDHPVESENLPRPAMITRHIHISRKGLALKSN
jgi:hypothetical protein